MMTMYVMTLGELNYHDEFMPWEDLPFPTLTNILFIVLVLGMPIIMMNMLVSLATLYLFSNLQIFLPTPDVFREFPRKLESQRGLLKIAEDSPKSSQRFPEVSRRLAGVREVVSKPYCGLNCALR